jgi:hypothetical protein
VALRQMGKINWSLWRGVHIGRGAQIHSDLEHFERERGSIEVCFLMPVGADLKVGSVWSWVKVVQSRR